jgi:hypothetical protein
MLFDVGLETDSIGRQRAIHRRRSLLIGIAEPDMAGCRGIGIGAARRRREPGVDLLRLSQAVMRTGRG